MLNKSADFYIDSRGSLVSNLATALAPNLASFFVFRALSAFHGTGLMLLGAVILG